MSVDERSWRQKANHSQFPGCRCGHDSRRHSYGSLPDKTAPEVSILGACGRCSCDYWCPAWHDGLPNFCHRGPDPFGLYAETRATPHPS